jgi:hypothetical protein
LETTKPRVSVAFYTVVMSLDQRETTTTVVPTETRW